MFQDAAWGSWVLADSATAITDQDFHTYGYTGPATGGNPTDSGWTVLNGTPNAPTVQLVLNQFTVSGAGTSDYNGVYVANGSYYSQWPMYELDSSHFLLVTQEIFILSQLEWILVQSNDPNSGFITPAYEGPAVSTAVTGLPTDPSGWQTGVGNGVDPSPTVVAS